MISSNSLLAIVFVQCVVCQWIRQISEHQICFYQNLSHETDSTLIETLIQVYSEDYDSSSDNPVLLHLTESTSETSSSLVSIAKSMKGLLLIMPIRFFAQSNIQSQSLKVSYLKYLTVDQIIEDILDFVKLFKTGNSLFYVSPSSPIILIGKDYLGSICYYANTKFPRLFQGVIAQDPILHVADQFPEYDRQIYNHYSSFDLQCPEQIQTMTDEIERLLNSGTFIRSPTLLKVKQDLLNKGTFRQVLEFISNLFYLIAEDIEKTKILCARLRNTSDIGSKVNDLIEISSVMPMEEVNEEQIFRMWLDCTHFGLFPTPYQTQNIRSQFVDIQYFQQKCLQKFEFDSVITFDYRKSNFLNEEVKKLEKALLISTNSVKRSTLKEHDPENITVVNCQGCNPTTSFMEPQDKIHIDLIQAIQTFINSCK